AAVGEWVPLAEVTRGTAGKSVRLVNVSFDGTHVNLAIGLVNNQLANVTPRTVNAGPSARAGFGATLSVLEHGVFIVGGISAPPPGTASHGAFTADAWHFGLETGRWTRLPLSGALPQKVLSVTFHPEDRSLYVLDEGIGVAPVARLLRIDVGSG